MAVHIPEEELCACGHKRNEHVGAVMHLDCTTCYETGEADRCTRFTWVAPKLIAGAAKKLRRAATAKKLRRVRNPK